ncbi:MAG: hypothetical protein IIW55_01570 [Bacteroidales bacterium]|nr:hypothetical protein [Bacteroidales bacterium]
MKRKIISLTFVSIFTMCFALELKAQRDAFFYTPLFEEGREYGSSGLSFADFSDIGSQEGLFFEDFNVIENTAPVGNGMFLMAATSALYLITKRRKEDK